MPRRIRRSLRNRWPAIVGLLAAGAVLAVSAVLFATRPGDAPQEKTKPLPPNPDLNLDIGSGATYQPATRKIRLRWPAGRPLQLAYVGDSITNGTLASSRSLSYSSLIDAALRKRGPIAVTSLSHGGAGIGYWKPAQIPSGSDLVVLELGTNDVYPKAWRAGLPRFERSYSRLVATVAAKSPNSQIVCVGVWRPDVTPEIVNGYDEAIRRNCGGVYVDISQAASTPAMRASDGFHPNDAGHAAIAHAIIAELR